MSLSIVPIGTLAIVFAMISILWISATVKEGRKAEMEIKNRRIAKAKNASIADQKELLNKLFKK